jgi:hypothetical protein
MIGQIGGFALTGATQPGPQDVRLRPQLALQRTDFAQAIAIDSETTPAGLIARLEHALDRMEAEREAERRRADAAEARLADYAPRLDAAFPLQAELEERRARLAAIEADLARSAGAAPAG